MNTNPVSKTIDNFIKAVRAEYEARGNCREDSLAYALGYLSSHFGMMIDGLPKNRQKEILNSMASITSDKLLAVVSSKRI